MLDKKLMQKKDNSVQMRRMLATLGRGTVGILAVGAIMAGAPLACMVNNMAQWMAGVGACGATVAVVLAIGDGHAPWYAFKIGERLYNDVARSLRRVRNGR